MASTNKTANLSLNQWVETDSFLMADANSDNAKLDAAIAALPYVKLLDFTTTSDTAEVYWDVSGIDFTKYAMVQVFSNAFSRGGTNGMCIYMRINGRGGTFDVEGTSNNQSSPYVAYFYQDNSTATSIRADIFGFQTHPLLLAEGNACTILSVHAAGGCNGSPTHSSCTLSLDPGVNGGRMTTINFLTPSNTRSIKAGSRFTLYGVKL